jgi:hypothetical protein
MHLKLFKFFLRYEKIIFSEKYIIFNLLFYLRHFNFSRKSRLEIVKCVYKFNFLPIILIYYVLYNEFMFFYLKILIQNYFLDSTGG